MKKKIWRYVRRALLVLLVTLVILVGTVYIMIYKCCNGPSKAARELFVTTILESGQMKFMASLVMSKEEILEIQNRNDREAMSTDIDKNLIQIENNNPDDPSSNPNADQEEFDENGVRIIEISGRTFFAKMMIVKDPSQVCVGTSYDNGWGEYGMELNQIVERTHGIGGVNGGLYESSGNKGGRPYGVVVQQGQITRNTPASSTGLYMVGLTEDNLLVIKDMKDITTEKAFIEYKESNKIRDAVCFQEENTDANNHFVPLIINGEGRELKGKGSGANPRTAIGQRADGALLILVTDGRGASGHLGATAADLISIMMEYGAVNAANIDGGSSSCMYYNNKWEMTSTTLYYQNSSWRLPDAFIVLPKSE